MFTCALFIIVLIIMCVVLPQEYGRRSRRVDYDDEPYLLPSKKVRKKADATHDILCFLAKTDDWFEPDYLDKEIAAIYKLVQKSVATDSWNRLKGNVYKDCILDLQDRIDDSDEEDILADLHRYALDSIDFVHVSCVGEPNEHCVTALLTADLKSRHRDDCYQEFWTFYRESTGWMLAKVLPNTRSKILKKRNRLPVQTFEMLQDEPEYRDLDRYIETEAE